MSLSDLLDLPHVEPLDRNATNGGVLQNVDLRTPAERKQSRPCDGIYEYRCYPLDCIGLGRDLGP